MLESQIVGSAVLFVLGLLSAAAHEEPGQFRSFCILAITLVTLCSVMWLLWTAPYAFAWELAKVAASLTVHSTFSTSFAAIARDVAVGCYVLLRIYRREGRFAAVLKHLDNAKDAGLALVASFVFVFLYHFFVSIPAGIRAIARNEQPPVIATSKTPPPNAYKKTRTAGTRRGSGTMPAQGPMFREASDNFNIVAGRMSTFLTSGFPTSCLIDVKGTCLVRGMVEGNKFVVDATLYSGAGKGRVELTRNVLHKDIPEWDRCYSNTALEVVDDNLVPVFQMVYTTPNDIVIYGIFHVSDLVVVLSPNGLDYHPANEAVSHEDYPVKRIFKYPSRTYHCREAGSSTVPAKKTSGPYRGLDPAQFCGQVRAEADRIYKMADGCLKSLMRSGDNKEPIEAQNRIRKDFSNEFMKCCSQTVRDMHEELLFRLKPLVESEGESAFREMDSESRHNATGVVLTTVESIAAYLRTSCAQIVK